MELKFTSYKLQNNLVFVFFIFFILCGGCGQSDIEENQQNVISETNSGNEPFSNLPCVINCNLTPTPSSYQLVKKDEILECRRCYLMNVTRIIDGDTVETNEGIIRFYGVDTPEKGEPCFKEASLKTKSLIKQDIEEPYIGSIRVEQGERSQDKYGRLLFYVYTLNGLSIDEILIKEGLARAWTKDGQHLEYLKELDSNYIKKDSRCFQNE